MNEKRFTVDDDGIYDTQEKKHFKFIAYDWMECDIYECCEKLNEQQALITNLQGDVNRLQYIIDELRKDNYKRFEKINELKAKLKEKEEDEQLYANEILELREANKEFIQFKELGGNY